MVRYQVILTAQNPADPLSVLIIRQSTKLSPPAHLCTSSRARDYERSVYVVPTSSLVLLTPVTTHSLLPRLSSSTCSFVNMSSEHQEGLEPACHTEIKPTRRVSSPAKTASSALGQPHQLLKYGEAAGSASDDDDSKPLTLWQRLDKIKGLICTLESHLAEPMEPRAYSGQIQRLFGSLHEAVRKVWWKDVRSAVGRVAMEITQDASSDVLKLEAAQQGEGVGPDPPLVFKRARAPPKGSASMEENHPQEFIQKLSNLLEGEADRQLRTGMCDIQPIREGYLGLVRLMIDDEFLKCDVDSGEELLCFDSLRVPPRG